ncbi:MAG: class I tRNA ligase family protein [Proteobacteria bacterium]|nr:class I tRNA ligase family protein [Pseudomonadota bacterium]
MPEDITTLLASLKTHQRAIVTAGMPYANGLLHIGHLAGAFIPADIYARWLRIVMGKDNVVFVSGTDDHGVKSQISAQNCGQDLKELINDIRKKHIHTLKSYHISCDHYGSTSATEHLAEHSRICQGFMEDLQSKGLLSIKTTNHWFDTEANMFLPDHMVSGECPQCGATAHSQGCDSCSASFRPEDLKHPKSTLSSSIPILKPTRHLWLDMYPLAKLCFNHINHSKRIEQKGQKKDLLAEIAPALSMTEDHFATIKTSLPPHKRRGQKHITTTTSQCVILAFRSYEDLDTAKQICDQANINYTIENSWAQRSISRDTTWGIALKLKEGLELTEQEYQYKSFYVWPESLIAPISFTQQAVRQKHLSHLNVRSLWYDSQTRIHQFLGIDNLYFYGVMQTALFLATRDDPQVASNNTLQMTNLHGSYHLQSNGQKMSKSTGNFYTADELLADGIYSSDQIRYYLAFLSLREKTADFNLTHLKERNAFLAGPLNAALEKPISACHAKFSSKVPRGELLKKAQDNTLKVIRQYVKFMPMAKYPTFLLAVENYARTINSLFATHKPHDDRYPLKDREDALYSCFYILKNLMILLAPFAPQTMDTLRENLNLSEDVYSVDQLGIPLPHDHEIAPLKSFF